MNDEIIDITRPEGLFLVCVTCGLERSVPPNWREIWAPEVQCVRHDPPTVMVEMKLP